ncbi:transketolase family protein [bacterium]|nr:transketolase family protein [bacterium]
MKAAPTRDGYGRALLELGEKDATVVALEADLGKSTRSVWFGERYPERWFSMGISEQNMMLVAAGLAANGHKPFVSTFAIFTERAFEQVRNGIARPNLPVRICGSHGGIHTGEDGSSAQCAEDLAIYRTLPNMTVMHPADDHSAHALLLASSDLPGPSYMRTCRNPFPRLYQNERDERLAIGRGVVLREGADVALIACGLMVSLCLDAARELAKNGVAATVVDMHTIKPLDEALVTALARECGALVTAEDHNVIGGLGGAVAECLAKGHPAPLEMIGVQDRFGESGKPMELFKLLGMTAPDIAAAATRAVARKREG